jgi:hypothetical protein
LSDCADLAPGLICCFGTRNLLATCVIAEAIVVAALGDAAYPEIVLED